MLEIARHGDRHYFLTALKRLGVYLRCVSDYDAACATYQELWDLWQEWNPERTVKDLSNTADALRAYHESL